MPVSLTTWEAEAENYKFQANLGNLVRPCHTIKFKKAVICRETDGSGYPCVEQDKPSSERQILHVFAHMWTLNLKKNYNMITKEGLLGGPAGGRRRKGEGDGGWM
jgi:hypothetical protein